MNLKKIFINAVTTLMTFSCISYVNVFAEEGLMNPDEALTDGNFTYELVNGSYTITGCDANSIITSIPTIRNGYAVTAIGDGAFVGCSGISELKIPDTIRSIGMNAFAGCTSLKKITIPETVTEISSGAFMRCTLLSEVTLPDTLTTIGNYAFAQCTSLESMKLPESLVNINPEAFTDCWSLKNFDASDCPSFVFEDGILMNSSKSEIYRGSVELDGDLYIDNNISAIKPGAFSGCFSIESLFIPSSVSTIGADAFSNCSSLKKIDLEQGLSVLEAGAFMYCSSLETVSIPLTVTDIPEETFAFCTSLNKVIIPEGVTSIGASAFLGCENLTKINIPKSVKSVGDYALGYTTGEEDYEKTDGFSMSVYSGSDALKYAKSNGIKHTVADRNIKQIAFIIIGVGIVIAIAVFAVILMMRNKKGAPMNVKKARKIEEQQKIEDSYEGIINDDKK
ncbi:MAG: leucine-rich repeat domain-containing protein [Ruminococcus sp.]|nr:leucine-rich repeat domain-containing protein [Ruminococcus sp.]